MKEFSGIASTTALGTVIARAGIVVPAVEFRPVINTAVGSVTITGKATVSPTGVSSTGAVGSSNIWGLIDTSASTTWTPIAA